MKKQVTAKKSQQNKKTLNIQNETYKDYWVSKLDYEQIYFIFCII